MHKFSFFLILSLLPLSLSAMQIDLTKVVQDEVLNPEALLKRLGNFSASELRDYHDEQHNNLMHVVVKELVKHKEQPNYGQYQEGIKPVFRYLALKGVCIDGVNDERMTPMAYAHSALPKDPKSGTVDTDADFTLVDFFQGEMGADPSRFSLDPEIRACTKKLRACKDKIFAAFSRCKHSNR